MRAVKDLPSIHPLQKQTIQFDYGPFLRSPVTITTILSVINEAVVGDDPNAQNLVLPDATIGTATAPEGSGYTDGCVFQDLDKGSIAGVRYKLTCIVQLSNGNEEPLEVFYDCKTA